MPAQYPYKTTMCNNIMSTGACPYANKCTFAHSEAEMAKWRAHNNRRPSSHVRRRIARERASFPVVRPPPALTRSVAVPPSPPRPFCAVTQPPFLTMRDAALMRMRATGVGADGCDRDRDHTFAPSDNAMAPVLVCPLPNYRNVNVSVNASAVSTPDFDFKDDATDPDPDLGCEHDVRLYSLDEWIVAGPSFTLA